MFYSCICLWFFDDRRRMSPMSSDVQNRCNTRTIRAPSWQASLPEGIKPHLVDSSCNATRPQGRALHWRTGRCRLLRLLSPSVADFAISTSQHHWGMVLNKIPIVMMILLSLYVIIIPIHELAMICHEIPMKPLIAAKSKVNPPFLHPKSAPRPR